MPCRFALTARLLNRGTHVFAYELETSCAQANGSNPSAEGNDIMSDRLSFIEAALRDERLAGFRNYYRSGIREGSVRPQ